MVTEKMYEDLSKGSLLLNVVDLRDYLVEVLGWRLLGLSEEEGLYVLDRAGVRSRAGVDVQIHLPVNGSVEETRAAMLSALVTAARVSGLTPLGVWLGVPSVRRRVLEWVGGCDSVTQDVFLKNLNALLRKCKLQFGKDFL